MADGDEDEDYKQQVQQLRGPVEILLEGEAGVEVVAGAVPRHQPRLVLPLAANFHLKSQRG